MKKLASFLILLMLSAQVFANLPQGWPALPPEWTYDAGANIIRSADNERFVYDSTSNSYVFRQTGVRFPVNRYIRVDSGAFQIGTTDPENPAVIYTLDEYKNGEWSDQTLLTTPIAVNTFVSTAAPSGSPAPAPASSPSPPANPAPPSGPGPAPAGGGSGVPLPAGSPSGWTQPNLGALTADGKEYVFDRELNMYINEADNTFISITPDGTILRGSVQDLNVNNPVQNLQIFRDGAWQNADSSASSGVTLQTLATRDAELNSRLFPTRPTPEPTSAPSSPQLSTNRALDQYSSLSAGATGELTSAEREALASASQGGFVVLGDSDRLEYFSETGLPEGQSLKINEEGILVRVQPVSDTDSIEHPLGRALPPSFVTALAQGGDSVRRGTDSDGRNYFYTPYSAPREEGLVFDFIPSGGDVRIDNGDGTFTTVQDRTVNRCGIGCTGKPDELVEVSREQNSRTTQMFSVGEGDERRQVELTKEETKGLFNIPLVGNKAVDLGRNTVTYNRDEDDPTETNPSMTYTSPPRRDSRGNIVEPGRVLFTRNSDDEYVDQNGNVVDREYALEQLEDAGLDVIDRRRVIRDQDREVLKNPGYSIGEKVEVMGVFGSVGFLMKAYNQYSGLTQLSNLIWDKNAKEVEERRQKMIQSFCLAGGIENCLVSAICGEVHEITPSNVIAGRGPGGVFVSSGVIVAERSFPIDIRGLSRQQLIDTLGRNVTTINGIRVDLSNPALNISRLGNLTLRLYHIQASITNNVAGEKDVRYNVELRRTGARRVIEVESLPAPSSGVPASIETGDVEFDTAYAEPVSQAKLFPKDIVLKPTESTPPDKRHHYFNSFAEWDVACILAQPGLPKGSALDSSFAREFCTPIVEYQGGPTEISAEDAQPPAGLNTTRDDTAAI